jgi:Ala-tRNA(Pro) deacylase
MSVPKWVKETLDLPGVAYEETTHPDAYTAQEVAHLEHMSGHRVAKVVVVMADGRPVELVMPASRHVCMDRLRGILGTRNVRLATEQEMEKRFADSEVGSLPPLRHGQDTEVIMDLSLDVPGDILIQAGTHHDAIRLRYADWYKLVCPRVESFTEPCGT